MTLYVIMACEVSYAYIGLYILVSLWFFAQLKHQAASQGELTLVEP